MTPDIDPESPAASLDDRLQQAVLLGMRNVLLEELVEIARGHGAADLLFQAAVSTAPDLPRGPRAHARGRPRGRRERPTSPRTTGGSVAGLPLPGRLGLGPSLDRPGARHD